MNSKEAKFLNFVEFESIGFVLKLSEQD